jgi:hypothetical protein
LDQPLAAYVQHGGNTYGWTKPRFREFSSIFRDRTDELSRFAAAAESRALILEIASTILDGVWSQRARDAYGCYQKLSKLYSARRILYASTNLGDRFKAFRAILAMRGYAGQWNLPFISLMTDLCVGLPIGPIARRYIDQNSQDLA